MVREKHHIIDHVSKILAQNTYLQMAGCKFGKTMPVNWYTVAVSLCHFFNVTFMLRY